MCCDESSEEISLVPLEDVPIGTYFLLAMIAATLLPSKLMRCVEMLNTIVSQDNVDPLGSCNALGKICKGPTTMGTE